MPNDKLIGASLSGATKAGDPGFQRNLYSGPVNFSVGQCPLETFDAILRGMSSFQVEAFKSAKPGEVAQTLIRHMSFAKVQLPEAFQIPQMHKAGISDLCIIKRQDPMALSCVTHWLDAG